MSTLDRLAKAAVAVCIGCIALLTTPAQAGNFPTAFVPGDFPTNQFDDRRTGWNPNETTLTVSNVNSTTFGQVWTAPLDSRVYAQPIVAMQETVAGATHNVVFVATANDTLYAFDANTGGSPLWVRSFQNPASGVTSVPDSFFGGCLTFAPSLGIEQTPVYDRATHSLYVVAATLEGATGAQHIHFRLHQLAVASGSDMRTPRLIAGTVSTASGPLTFDPDVQADRPALLESDGTIYVGFGSFDDFFPSQSHGWIFAYDAATFARVGLFSPTEGAAQNNEFLGSLWAGGIGMAADDSGNVFFATGNGPFDGTSNFGDSVIRFSPTLARSSLQFFTPSNFSELQTNDLDLGAGGVVLFPAQTTGLFPHLLWIEGKNNVGYLLDADQLSGLSSSTNRGFIRSVHTRAIFGSGVSYQDSTGALYYYTNDNSPGASSSTHLARYQVGTGPTASAYTISETLSATVPFTRPSGATPEISSNGTTAGTAIIWYIDRPLTTGPLTLFAYDAEKLGTPLFSASAGQWVLAATGALIEPTVTNGRVYVAADDQLTVFGLLP